MCWLHASDEGTCILAFHFCVLGLLALVSITPTNYGVYRGHRPSSCWQRISVFAPPFCCCCCQPKRYSNESLKNAQMRSKKRNAQMVPESLHLICTDGWFYSVLQKKTTKKTMMRAGYPELSTIVLAPRAQTMCDLLRVLTEIASTSTCLTLADGVGRRNPVRRPCARREFSKFLKGSWG